MAAAPPEEDFPSSAPVMDSVSSVYTSPATAPPMFSELSDQLAMMSPHHQVSSLLQTMHPYHQYHQEVIEDQNIAVERNVISKDISKNLQEEVMIPFTDTQLHALYHNVELEKNVEFVDHWLDTQKNVERFQLDEMLLNYLRVRTMLCNSRRKYENDREKMNSLEKELWTMSLESVESMTINDFVIFFIRRFSRQEREN